MTPHHPVENPLETGASSAPREPLPAHARQIAQAVSEIGAARKKILMYPAGHVQVNQTIDRALHCLEQILSSRAEVTVAADKEGLFIDPDSISLADPVSQELSSLLRHNDVAAIRFLRGLPREELATFLHLIAQDREGVHTRGGLEKALLKARIQHIRALSIDYSKFLHTDEQEVNKQHRRGLQDPSDWIWRNFVSHLIQGTLSDSKQGAPIQSAAELSPHRIARYLNEQLLNTQTALESYEKSVHEHLGQMSEPQAGLQFRARNFENLKALLEELHPSIRRQFLDVTYRQCEDRKGTPQVEELLGGISHGLVIEMLRHANQDGNEVSPTLLNLVRKIASTRNSHADTGSGAETDRSHAASADPEQQRQVQELFQREAYETYVPSDYGSILEDLSRDFVPGPEDPEESPELQQYLHSLESRHLDVQIARALMAFMAVTTRTDEYRDYAEKVFGITNDLIGEGEFAVPLDVLTMFERDRQERSDDSTRSAAEEYLKRFRHSSFVSKALAAFDKWKDKEHRMAEEFVTAIGTAIVPQALSLYLQRDESERGDHLFRLLSAFADRVAEEAKVVLRARRGSSLVRLIILIRRLDAKELTDALRPFLDHHDRKVSLEVLETLVRFQDPESNDLLSRSLKTRDPDELLRAIETAGRYKVEKLAPDLASMVRTFSLFRLDYQKNEKIIEALGRIGHPCAIPVLERLARARWSLYPKQLLNLKRQLYQSLKSYDQTLIGPLLKIGFQCSDPSIQSACRELMQKTGGMATGSLFKKE